jgi:hypothetical protein
MKTKKEKQLDMKTDKELMSNINVHIDRGTDRIVSALRNLQIASHNNDMSKIQPSMDYLIDALENLTTLKFATHVVDKRYIKKSKECKQRASYIKAYIKRETPVDVVMPKMLFEEEI